MVFSSSWPLSSKILFILNYDPPKHDNSEHFKCIKKSVLQTVEKIQPIKCRKKGRGHFRQFRTGFTTSHSSQIIPWGQVNLNQLRYPLLNESAYNFEPGPRLSVQDNQVQHGRYQNVPTDPLMT